MENIKKGDTSRYKKGGQAVKEKTKYYTTEDNGKRTFCMLHLRRFSACTLAYSCTCTVMFISAGWFLQRPGHDCICKSVRSGQYCMADTIASDTGMQLQFVFDWRPWTKILKNRETANLSKRAQLLDWRHVRSRGWTYKLALKRQKLKRTWILIPLLHSKLYRLCFGYPKFCII